MISVHITSRGVSVTGVEAPRDNRELRDVASLIGKALVITAEQGKDNYYQHASQIRYVTDYNGLEIVADSGAKIVLLPAVASVSLPTFNTTDYPYAI